MRQKRVDNVFSNWIRIFKKGEVFKLPAGERQLIAIMADGYELRYYFTDEPTAIGLHGNKKINGTLLPLPKKEGKTPIISEHRLYYLHDLLMNTGL